MQCKNVACNWIKNQFITTGDACAGGAFLTTSGAKEQCFDELVPMLFVCNAVTEPLAFVFMCILRGVLPSEMNGLTRCVEPKARVFSVSKAALF